MDKEWIKFRRVECGENSIKQIRFVSSNWTKWFVDGIADILKNIETVTLNNITNVRLVEFLSNLPHLKDLTIDGFFSGNVVWTRNKCGYLKSLTCVIEGSVPVVHLSRFLKQHPSITRLNCRTPMSEAKEIIKIVVQHKNIEEFIFSVRNRIDFSCIKSELEALDRRTNFKRFGLNACGKHIKNFVELASLKSFVELNLRGGNCDPYVSAISSLVNLKELTLDYASGVSDADAENLSKSLQKLEKLTFAVSQEFEQIQNHIQAFVCHSSKLAEMKLNVRMADETELDYGQMNETRKQLESASKVIISIYGTKFQKIPNYDLVEFKIISELFLKFY